MLCLRLTNKYTKLCFWKNNLYKSIISHTKDVGSEPLSEACTTAQQGLSKLTSTRASSQNLSSTLLCLAFLVGAPYVLIDSSSKLPDRQPCPGDISGNSSAEDRALDQSCGLSSEAQLLGLRTRCAGGLWRSFKNGLCCLVMSIIHFIF